MPRSSPHTSLAAAWRALGHDPVGLLGIAGCALAADAVLMWIVWPRLPWSVGALLAALVAVEAARVIVSAPARAALITRSARLQGLPSRRWAPRVPALMATDAIGRAAALAAGGVGALPVAVAAWAAVAIARPELAAFVGGLAALTGASVAWLVRARLAQAPHHAVLDGRGAVSALRAAWSQGSQDLWPQVTILAVADILWIVGAACCGVGALPAYALPIVALIDRWKPAPGVPRVP